MKMLILLIGISGLLIWTGNCEETPVTNQPTKRSFSVIPEAQRNAQGRIEQFLGTNYANKLIQTSEIPEVQRQAQANVEQFLGTNYANKLIQAGEVTGTTYVIYKGIAKRQKEIEGFLVKNGEFTRIAAKSGAKNCKNFIRKTHLGGILLAACVVDDILILCSPPKEIDDGGADATAMLFKDVSSNAIPHPDPPSWIQRNLAWIRLVSATSAGIGVFCLWRYLIRRKILRRP